MNTKCCVSVAAIKKEPCEKSEMISQMLYGETCKVQETNGNFSKIITDFDETEGWINSQLLKKNPQTSEQFLVEQSFGIFDLKDGKTLLSIGSEVDFPTEKFADKNNLRQSIAETARKFLNVPFLSGGRSFFGTDSAGFVQLVYKIHGIALPRFPEKLAETGEVLYFVEESKSGDLAFFENENGDVIHVGIALENQQIIHNFGKVRIDILDSTGIFNKELNRHTHKLRFVKNVF
ncbi:MAG: C40 family peptidase [Flavobacteriaceae bacterium]|jgi:cell wall-associated NlpC family hydrolase|nr:C40 family peptidase [Flavobacteriaceae bacterium]